jgi:dTDP-glucose 4,6-dehydratase
MKILVYGHKGWIGQQFIKILRNNQTQYDYIYVLGQSRVENTSEMMTELDNIKPTHVVSFIGRTHGEIDGKVYSTIDYLEQKGKLKENVRDNLFSPLSLALACKERNIHYTYLGTGCIFSYIKDQEHNGFNESSLPNFTGSSYSTVKGFTDMLMHQLEDTVLNLRIRMPIIGEDNPRNFITKITNYEKVCSIPNSMTVLPELLPKILKLMQHNVKGTLNFTNPGTISHNEILEMYKKYVDPEFTWQNFSVEEQNKILASERSNNLLDTKRLQLLVPEVKHIKESVELIMQNYKYNPEMHPKQNNNTKDVNTDVDENKIIQTTNVNITKDNNNVNIVNNSFDFTDNENVLLFVTGGAGFIGSNFINELFNEYHNIKVINFDALYYCANEKNVKEEIRNNPNYTFINGNLQSFDLLKYIFETNKITHVLHFAAQSHVQNSFTNAIQYTQDNILGTHNLLEVARLYCPTLQKFIHVSTDEVYGESMLEADEKHKTEQSVLCPTNPYAASKAGAELIAQSYNHSFKMPIIITRGNNVYGPNQYPEKVIPRFIEQLKNNQKVTIQGDGSCVRGFLHAYDTASAFIKILEKGTTGEIYNIGCDEGMEYSVLEVAKILIKKIKNTENYEDWITFIEDRPFNDKRYYISNQKLKDLGWTIKISFTESLDNLL